MGDYKHHKPHDTNPVRFCDVHFKRLVFLCKYLRIVHSISDRIVSAAYDTESDGFIKSMQEP